MGTDETQIERGERHPQIARINADEYCFEKICENPRNLRITNLCFICVHLWLDNKNVPEI